MQTTQFFQGLLGLSSPYSIGQVHYRRDEKSKIIGVDVYIEIIPDYLPNVRSGIVVEKHDKEARTWRHLNLFEYPCYLHCEVPKYRYNNGTKKWTKTLEVPWSRKGSRFTLLFEQMVMSLVQITGCPEEVSKIVGERSQKIWTIIDHYEPVDLGELEEELLKKASKKQKEEDLQLTDIERLRDDSELGSEDWIEVKKLNLDETSRKKGHDYVSNFWDAESGELLSTEVGKSSKVIEEFVRKGLSKGLDPAKIEEVNIDMSPAFIKGVRFYFSQADINFDKFHVSQLVGRGLDTFRKAQQRKTGEKFDKWLILKPKESLSLKEKLELNQICDFHPDLELVHAHKNIFANLWQMEQAEERQSYLAFWADQMEEFGERFKSRKLKSLGKTLNKHFDGILNAVKNGADNGFAEGMHSKIQTMKRKARGYKTFKRFVQMIRIHCANKANFSTQIT